MKTILTLIILSWLLDAFKDAIDFGSPPGRWMKELWHIAKGLSYGMLYFYMIWTALPQYWLVLILFILFMVHEIPYSIFRTLEVWKWDERLKIPFVNNLWLLDGRKRDKNNYL